MSWNLKSLIVSLEINNINKSLIKTVRKSETLILWRILRVKKPSCLHTWPNFVCCLNKLISKQKVGGQPIVKDLQTEKRLVMLSLKKSFCLPKF